MSDIIRLLPDSVANQIAAGEVIQRPASVIKELVENSVDAGATSITIIIKDAGRTLIQVVDNGSGMSETDARLSFERHATSKIKNADDLFSLHTMGFRGEALASIAAISQIDMRTMKHGESLGTRLLINASKVESQNPEACVPGTNLMVKNIFFNVPARRKFLKKDAVEMSNIMREYERLAMVNTDIDFTLIHNDVTVSQLRPGNLKQRVCELFGKSLEKQIIPVETNVSFVKINGFISLPEHARRRNALQYFFVNGRNMRHPYFHKAVMSCYDELIAPDVQPCYFLNFEVEPSSIDVNIHPTKNEIKFENEKEIWQVLSAAVREALGRFNAVPSIDFTVDDSLDIPAFDPNALGEHGLDIDPTYNPFETGSGSHAENPAFSRPSALNTPAPEPVSSGYGSGFSATRASALNDWEKLYENFKNDSRFDIPAEIPSALNSADSIEQLPGLEEVAGGNTILQVGNKFILTPTPTGLMLVDRNRANTLVLYNRYLEMARQHHFSTQKVLFPETLTLSPSAQAIMLSISPILKPLGFEMTCTGDNTWSITGIPAELKSTSAADTLLALVEAVTDTGDEPSETVCRKLALAMARSATTNARNTMTDAEAEQLLADLLRLPAPTYTPDGLTVLKTISVEELAKML